MLLDYRQGIKNIRTNRALTIKEIANYLHCSHETYRRYESGERSLPLPIAIKLADYYQVSLDALIGHTIQTHIKMQTKNSSKC